jgi:hypothetical protein
MRFFLASHKFSEIPAKVIFALVYILSDFLVLVEHFFSDDTTNLDSDLGFLDSE